MAEHRATAVTVAQIAECVQGEILNSADQSDQLVDNLMVGAMGVEPTPVYFGVKPDKAVITRGDRADIQLGALETSIRCMVLTGGVKPIATVLQRAEEKKVPLILVATDTAATLAQLQTCFGQTAVADPSGEGEAAQASADQEVAA